MDDSTADSTTVERESSLLARENAKLRQNCVDLTAQLAAPRPRTVASSDAGAAATSSDKKAGPFAGFRKRFGGGAKGEEL